MKLHILDVAVEDLAEAAKFYDSREPELGDYFLECLYADMERLKTTAGVHPLAYRGVRRALSARFPYAIYYSMHCEEVTVRAVIDCRRNPAWIHRHTKPKR